MSDKAAAAQKWAEAKEALDAARAAFEAAKAALGEADAVELAAWKTLEALSDRVYMGLLPMPPTTPTMNGPATVAADLQREREKHFQRLHDLPIRPLG